jgi:hypothetical protein
MTAKKQADIAAVIGAMFSATQRDASNVYAFVADEPSVIVARKLAEAQNGEDFFYQMQYPFEQVIDGLLENVFPGNNDAKFIMANHNFIERHFVNLICKMEGSPCSADKSRTICRSLMHFFTSNQPIEFNYQGEYTFHLPKKIFTTHAEIVEFYYGIRDLYCGRSDRYLSAMLKILQTVRPSTIQVVDVQHKPHSEDNS